MFPSFRCRCSDHPTEAIALLAAELPPTSGSQGRGLASHCPHGCLWLKVHAKHVDPMFGPRSLPLKLISEEVPNAYETPRLAIGRVLRRFHRAILGRCDSAQGPRA